MASTTSGISQVSTLKPSRSTISTSRPRVGMARQALATLMTAIPPRRACPIHRPSGTAISAATSRARPQ